MKRYSCLVYFVYKNTENLISPDRFNNPMNQIHSSVTSTASTSIMTTCTTLLHYFYQLLLEGRMVIVAPPCLLSSPALYFYSGVTLSDWWVWKEKSNMPRSTTSSLLSFSWKERKTQTANLLLCFSLMQISQVQVSHGEGLLGLVLLLLVAKFSNFNFTHLQI